MAPLLAEHFENRDLDIRKKSPGYYRFMDQKVTPDVLNFVAECIVQYTENTSEEFTAKDIEESDYFVKMVPYVFNKPVPGTTSTKNEYNKWTSQTIQTLRFAQVLGGDNGKPVKYSVLSKDVLEYIATRPQNAYVFLVTYITKVLKDSGFYKHFEAFRNLYYGGKSSRSDFSHLRMHFIRFIHAHTNIKGQFEPRRILPKVLNILSSEHRIPGSVRGFMSEYPFMTSDLIYNRVNFRDKEKAKDISRQEQAEHAEELKKRLMPKSRIANAKAKVKELHRRHTEVHDQWGNGIATQVHHIFPESEYPQLADKLENLILITATQHNTKAHPNNRTQEVDPEYQLVCLLSKSDSIEKSINAGEFNYSREAFIGVINTGLNLSLSHDLTFEEIRSELKTHYTT